MDDRDNCGGGSVAVSSWDSDMRKGTHTDGIINDPNGKGSSIYKSHSRTYQYIFNYTCILVEYFIIKVFFIIMINIIINSSVIIIIIIITTTTTITTCVTYIITIVRFSNRWVGFWTFRSVLTVCSKKKWDNQNYSLIFENNCTDQLVFEGSYWSAEWSFSFARLAEHTDRPIHKPTPEAEEAWFFIFARYASTYVV